MKRLSIFILSICMLGAFTTQAAVDACITVPAPYTISSKTVYICKGEWIDMTVNNCLGNTTNLEENYSWRNIDNAGIPITSGKTKSTQFSGRWEVTLTNTTDWTTDKDTLEVVFHSQPTFVINGDAPSSQKCEDAVITINATNNSVFSNYNWYITGYPTSIGTGTSLLVDSIPLPDGKGFYTATAFYSVTGCTVSDTIFLITFPTPLPDLGNDTALCVGQSLDLVATNILTIPDSTITYGTRYQFRWNNTGGYINNDSIRTVNTSGTYFVSVRGPSPYTCFGSDTINVTFNPVPVVEAGDDSTICYGSSIQFSDASVSGASAPYTYAWSPKARLNDSTLLAPLANPLSTTVYTLGVTSLNCTGYDTRTVTILPRPTITPAFTDSTISLGDTITLATSVTGGTPFAGPVYNYSWSPVLNLDDATAASPDAYPTSPTSYMVIVTDQMSCKDTAFIDIDLEGGISSIYIPTAFNPDMSEPNNAHLRVYGNNISNDSFVFRVYNKWGEVVYETQSFDEASQSGWNGSLNNTGSPLNMGVYTYTVSGLFTDGTSFEKAGTASLLR